MMLYFQEANLAPAFRISFSSGSLQQRDFWETDKSDILFIPVDDIRPEIQMYKAGHMTLPMVGRFAKETIYFE